MKGRPELHLVEFPAGHILAGHECWCEPILLGWTEMEDGTHIFEIEHRDDCPTHHRTILHERDIKQDWITRTLNEVNIEKE